MKKRKARRCATASIDTAAAAAAGGGSVFADASADRTGAAKECNCASCAAAAPAATAA